MGPNLVDYLLYEPEETGILWIKFNRPERMNALIGSAEEHGTVAKVGEYMRAGDDNPDIRVIVLTGVGRGFCSGADMKRDTADATKGERFIGDRGTTAGPDAAREHFFHGRVHANNTVPRGFQSNGRPDLRIEYCDEWLVPVVVDEG